jgi:hypothetical protein
MDLRKIFWISNLGIRIRTKIWFRKTSLITYLDVWKKNGDDVIAPALKVCEKALEEGGDSSQHNTVSPQVRILS